MLVDLWKTAGHVRSHHEGSRKTYKVQKIKRKSQKEKKSKSKSQKRKGRKRIKPPGGSILLSLIHTHSVSVKGSSNLSRHWQDLVTLCEYLMHEPPWWVGDQGDGWFMSWIKGGEFGLGWSWMNGFGGQYLLWKEGVGSRRQLLPSVDRLSGPQSLRPYGYALGW